MSPVLARKLYGKKLALAHRHIEAERFPQAEEIYRWYLDKGVDDPHVWRNLGTLIQRRAGDDHATLMQAFDCYARACDSAVIDDASKAAAVNNMGLLMMRVGEVQIANELFMRALVLDSNLAAAATNYGDTLRHLGRYEEASAAFNEAVRLDPDGSTARFGAGMMSIMLGDFKRGWRDYEYRFGATNFPTKLPNCKVPMWKGEDLS